VEHDRTYGYAIPGRTIELVNCRLTALGRVPRGAPEPPPSEGSPEAARIGERRVYFDREIGWRDTPVYDRDLLPAGARLTGPAVIEEMSATTVAFPGQIVQLDSDGNIVLRQTARSATTQEALAHA
jgi:N-methylhydantoinase A